MRTLVIGGSRSGKSAWAEGRFEASAPVTYVATALLNDPSDTNWQERIAIHRNRRPAHWSTLEMLDVVAVLRSGAPSVLIEDLGNWVSGTLDVTGGWDGEPHAYRAQVAEFVQAWQEYSGHVVLVSNDVGGGIHPATAAGRIFSDEVGSLNIALAAVSDQVVHVMAGLPLWLKGQPEGTSR